MIKNVIGISAVLLYLGGCAAPMQTKIEAYPLMYTPNKPVSMIIVPAINETTAADAGSLLNVTVSQPFANHGYYVMPVPIIADIFNSEGILDGQQAKSIPPSLFKEKFGADSVMFMTIEEWDKNYAVLAGNVTVGIEYVLMSTETSAILWSYEQRIVIDTTSSSGNIFADLVATAISTASTKYIPIASKVHQTAVVAMPYGGYHPNSGTDGAVKSVKIEAKENALIIED